MTDLDEHLRREFASVRARVEQLPLPALSDHDAPRGRKPRVVLALLSAAVVLAVAVAAIAFTRPSPRRPATTTARPAPTGPPVLGFATVAVNGNGHSITVWNWTGRKVATVDTRADVSACCGSVSLSPDGLRLFVSSDGKTMPDAQVLDLRGHVLAQQRQLDGEWADDSRHLCTMRAPAGSHGFYTGPTHLVLEDPGHGSRVVATVGADGPHAGPVIYACSVVRDTALVGTNVMASTRGPLSQVRLSTGRVSSSTWSTSFSDIAAVSGNGQYAIVQAAAGASAVIDTATGRTVASVPGQPQAISWNGHLIVSTLEHGDLAVTDWRTHRVLWRSGHQSDQPPELFANASVRGRPHSDDLALDVTNVIGQPLNTGTLWLVRADFPPRRIATDVVPGVD